MKFRSKFDNNSIKIGSKFDQKLTDRGNGRTLVFADRRDTFSMLQVWDQCSRFEDNRSNFDQFLHSRIWSNYDRKIDQICSKIDAKFVSFVVQLAQTAIKILVPAFFRTPIFKIAPFGAQRTLQGRFRDTPGSCRGRSRPSPGTTWAPWDPPGGSQDRLLVDFGCPEDLNCFKFHQSFDGNSIIFRRKFDQRSAKNWSRLDRGSIKIRLWSKILIEMPDRLSWSNFLIKFLDQISWSKLLIEFLDHICWSTFLIMISFCTDLFSWSNFLLHLSDHALVGLVRNSIELGRIACSIWSLFWPDLIIWSDLIGPVWSKYVAAFVISIKLLVRIACSNFLIKFLDPSFRSRFGRLGSKFYRTWSNCLSDLISVLTWPDHLIWSDRTWSDRKYRSHFLIAFPVQVCWSNFLIHLSDHDIFSYRSLQFSRSTLLVILSDQFPFCSDPFFTAFKFLVQICWSSFRSCAFFFWPFF